MLLTKLTGLVSAHSLCAGVPLVGRGLSGLPRRPAGVTGVTSYTVPAGDAVNFNFVALYNQPAGDAVNCNFVGV